MGDGQTRRKTLVPLDEAHAGQLLLQGIQSIQNLARLKADLPWHRSRDPDDDLENALVPNQALEKANEIRCGHDLEGTGNNPPRIRDGDTAVHLSQIEGSDPSARITGGGQGFATPARPAGG